MKRFIALDPSSTFTGWSVFQDDGLVAWGKVDMTKVEYHSRFSIMVENLKRLVQKYGVQEIAIEDVKTAWRSKFRVRNIAGLQIIFRSIQEWAKGVNLPLIAYNPATWKNAVVGHIHASKEITKANILLRFPTVPDNLSDHEYDAIAIGVYHAGLLKLESMTERGKTK